jgi:hypothetical protein
VALLWVPLYIYHAPVALLWVTSLQGAPASPPSPFPPREVCLRRTGGGMGGWGGVMREIGAHIYLGWVYKYKQAYPSICHWRVSQTPLHWCTDAGNLTRLPCSRSFPAAASPSQVNPSAAERGGGGSGRGFPNYDKQFASAAAAMKSTNVSSF